MMRMLSRSAPARTLTSTAPLSETVSERYWQAAYSVMRTVSPPTVSSGSPSDE